ncbi:hypothetical protein [Plebeiibacterium marinum]|uniref:Outer membrane protein beta-barrel domain-containing protein n=1 Tax=Plebeiibacterium marinum TaxID=2992111 RepID=A0AAE3SKK8_9BACT|nr:hypothetical protein [Plebeiobacterium marinum]MCW3806722.1 hypothetical protein [Plebeiobacterium marinum]
MKTIFISIFLILYSHTIFAQNKINAELRYNLIMATNINAPNYGFEDENSIGNSIRFLLGYHINNHININVGLGLDGYSNAHGINTAPLVLNIKYSPNGKPKGIFFLAEGGPQVTFSSTEDKGYMFLGGMGYKIKLSRLIRLNFLAGYNYQKTTKGFSNFDDDSSRQGFFIGTSISL